VNGETPLARIVAELDARGIPHMVAGSFASAYHGEPRTTHDIDLVIDPSREALDGLVRELDPERFYVSAEAADEAWRRRGHFNVVDLESGWKIDLILRKDRPFSHSEFARRQAGTILGTRVFVATAEDTILAKLEWARLGESERQIRDVVGVIGMNREGLDRAYIERWARELGIEALWERARSAAAEEGG
jgi:hypothetical protein